VTQPPPPPQPAPASPAAPSLGALYIRVRSDLVVTRQTHQDQLYYVIKDPVSLRYFRVKEEEHAIFLLLDGRRNLADVLALTNQRYPHLALTAEDLLNFVGQLRNVNFLENVVPQQGAFLYERAQLKRRMRSLWRQVVGIFYIKLSFCDPDRAFSRVLPYVRFLWSRWFLALVGLGFVSAVWIVVTHWNEMEFSLSALISPSSLFFFWIAFVVTKVAHELSHGLTCKHFGGEVHDMGCLILVLTPCLYCDISDAWTFESRWRKFATSFAGLFTELTLASWAAIIWWLTAPGLLNSLAYRVMFLSSISAVLINGNPLMRWDGYYILMDLLGMPNLRANSFLYLNQFLRRYVLGMPVPGAELSTRTRQIQLFYGLAATIWLVFVLAGICIAFLIKLPALGIWVTLTTVYGGFRSARRFFSYVGQNRRDIPLLHWPRVLIPVVVGVASIYLVCVLSLETWVEAPCVILPEERAVVHAEVPGYLEEVLVSEGEEVTPGQPLLRMVNPQLQLQERAEETAIKVLDFQIAQALGTEHLALMGVLNETRAARLARLRELTTQVDSLTVHSPIAGSVLTPKLDWLRGSSVTAGRSLCEVGQLKQMLVRLVVDERDLGGLAAGAEARVRLRAFPRETFTGAVRELSPCSLHEVPDLALSSQAGGDVPTYTDARARRVPTVPCFELTIELPNADGRLRPGMTGSAKVHGPSRTLLSRLLVRIEKGLKTTFHLR
jgi:putative peptide zinc metalloprotease protein